MILVFDKVFIHHGQCEDESGVNETSDKSMSNFKIKVTNTNVV